MRTERRSSAGPLPLGWAALTTIASLLLFAPTATAQLSTVSFTQSEVTVDEADGSVTVTLAIDGPGNNGGVLVGTVDGTAVDGDDFTAVMDYIEWPGADSSPKQFTVDLVSDAVPEEPEEFQIALSGGDGVTIGSPSSVTVTITEGGASPEAVFLIDDGILAGPLGEFFVPAESGVDLVVPMRLSEMPTSPTTVHYTVEGDATVHEVVFDGVQEQMVAIPHGPPPANAPLSTREVRIVGPRADGPRPRTGTGVFVETAGAEASCYVCGILWFWAGFDEGTKCNGWCALMYGWVCPQDLPASRNDPVDLLRRYRDEILTTTAGGQYYVDFYDDISPDATRATWRDPTLVYDIWRAREAWLDGFAALVNGTGAAFAITADMQDDLLDIVARLRAHGSPALDQKLADESARIGLDGIAGKTMTEFQSDVEAAGASVSIESMSWGRVKAPYRR